MLTENTWALRVFLNIQRISLVYCTNYKTDTVNLLCLKDVTAPSCIGLYYVHTQKEIKRERENDRRRMNATVRSRYFNGDFSKKRRKILQLTCWVREDRTLAYDFKTVFMIKHWKFASDLWWHYTYCSDNEYQCKNRQILQPEEIQLQQVFWQWRRSGHWFCNNLLLAAKTKDIPICQQTLCQEDY